MTRSSASARGSTQPNAAMACRWVHRYRVLVLTDNPERQETISLALYYRELLVGYPTRPEDYRLIGANEATCVMKQVQNPARTITLGCSCIRICHALAHAEQRVILPGLASTTARRPQFLGTLVSRLQDQTPDLIQAWHTYRRHGVVFIGIVYQDTASNARAFLREHGGGWLTLQDPDQRTAIDYGVYGVPETFFIDRRGVIRDKSTGPVTPELLSRDIQQLLQSKP